MPTTSVVGLDTAKNVFQLHGADRDGKMTFKKPLRRAQLTDFFANLPPCVIGLEATQGAHHWARGWRHLGIRCAWLRRNSAEVGHILTFGSVAALAISREVVERGEKKN